MSKKFLLIFCILFAVLHSSLKVEAAGFFEGKEDIVIVIDPGHGGENLGTDTNPNFNEKDINLITANALIEELSKYEGVTIYSTRTDDTDLSLRQRAEFAKSVDADFLFSIHYNASENHTIYGAEVWIPLYAPYHAPAYQFAYIELEQLEEMGLFIRGIKTREGNNKKDYYGIIREASALEIPAVIIEHCHVDEERDSQFCFGDEMFIEFGRRDAQAIATFLNLDGAEKSIPQHLTTLTTETIIENTYMDDTGADICHIAVENADYETGKLSLMVTGADYNTPLLYYDYSIDGGKTYSKRIGWPGSDALRGTYDDSFILELEIPENTKPRIIVRAYNKFDILKESNILTEFDTFRPVILDNNDRYAFLSVYEDMEDDIFTVDNPSNDSDSLHLFGAPFTFKRFLLLFGFAIFWVLLLISGLRIILRAYKK